MIRGKQLSPEIFLDRFISEKYCFSGPCEVRTHDLGVISTTLYRLS